MAPNPVTVASQNPAWVAAFGTVLAILSKSAYDGRVRDFWQWGQVAANAPSAVQHIEERQSEMYELSEEQSEAIFFLATEVDRATDADVDTALLREQLSVEEGPRRFDDSEPQTTAED